MGNAGSNQPVGHHHGTTVNREHRHNKDHPPPSPGKEGQAFVFDKKSSQKLVFQSSHEEEEPYFAKVISTDIKMTFRQKNVTLLYNFTWIYK